MPIINSAHRADEDRVSNPQIRKHRARRQLVSCGALACALLLSGCVGQGGRTSAEPTTQASAEPRITVLYDAFGSKATMKKDWGFAALIEIGGKRILFDTGDDAAVFEQNVRSAGVNLRQLDFVVLSHRHSDHIGGLSYLLRVNPKVRIYAPKENFGIFGSSLPSAFYRKAEALSPEMRYYDGNPPAIMSFGTAWPGAHFELIDQTSQIAPGMTLIALISDVTGTKELKELSLAIDTRQGIVLVVGCSHPGIEAIVAEAAKINPHIHLIVGGMHLVTAPDPAIEKIAGALRDTWKVDWIAPGHCTGEPAFAAFKQAFGARYLYAGLGTALSIGSLARVPGPTAAPAAVPPPEDGSSYQALLAAHRVRDQGAAD